MYHCPLVVGVQEFESWSVKASIADTLARLGANTGNLIFTQALLRILDGARWGSFNLFDHELEGRDVIVLAGANWVNSWADFGWLADRLEKIRLPVVLVGVGAQSTLSKEIPKVKEGTLRLLQLVQDRSKSISARGYFSCDVLSFYGFKHSVPTGCPSLLLAGPRGPSLDAARSISSADIESSSACIHSTRHRFNPPDSFNASLYEFALRHRIDIILQSETPDLHVLLDKLNESTISVEIVEALRIGYASSSIDEIIAFIKAHGRAFSNLDDWLLYMKTKRFCFGSRIHGTVASLIAGTPALLMAHDSRTLEMAEIMSIPYILCDNVNLQSTDMLPRLLSLTYELCAQSQFDDYISNYISFFQSNGLSASKLSGFSGID